MIDVRPLTQAEAIRDAAIESAQASRDAHGKLVLATTAWSFIRAVWYDSDDERYEALPDGDWPPIEFVAQYYNV